MRAIRLTVLSMVALSAVVIGGAPAAIGAPAGQPAVHAAAPTFTPLGPVDSNALSMSADGSTIVGVNIFGDGAFRWSHQLGTQLLGAGTGQISISRDGGTIVADVYHHGYRAAAIWKGGTHWRSLGGYPGSQGCPDISNAFAVSDTQYLLTFVVMLVVALVISGLTVRIRAHAAAARNRERRTAALMGFIVILVLAIAGVVLVLGVNYRYVDGTITSAGYAANVGLGHRCFDAHVVQIVCDGEEGGRVHGRGNRLTSLNFARDHPAINRRSDRGALQVDFGTLQVGLTGLHL
jgi:hypothetical protein